MGPKKKGGGKKGKKDDGEPPHDPSWEKVGLSFISTSLADWAERLSAVIKAACEMPLD